MTDRAGSVVGSLERDSLVGSFFHSTVEHGWQGLVVAEPRPGIYLVELFSWVMGDPTHQQLIPIEEMTGWRFYDDTEWMNNAYKHGGVQRTWDRQRAELASQHERTTA